MKYFYYGNGLGKRIIFIDYTFANVISFEMKNELLFQHNWFL